MAKKGFFMDWRFVVGFLAVFLIVSNGFWIWRWREQMRVVRVIDGDTLVIKAGDRVRLTGLDAPEIGKCGAEGSRQQLIKLLSDEVIKLENEKRDTWGRKLGIVYVDGINVNIEMVKSGWARFDNFNGGGSEELRLAGQEAEKAGRGIYGSKCAETKEMCNILGNVDQSTGKKYYHLPKCFSYSRVKISPERGERIFCNETEAKSAGFEPAPDCVR